MSYFLSLYQSPKPRIPHCFSYISKPFNMLVTPFNHYQYLLTNHNHCVFESLLFLHQTFLVSCLGSYSSSSGSTNCTQCPANHYCTTTTKTTCDPGSYSLIGSTSCEPCLGGYQCPGSGLDPELCDAGTYARNGSDICTTCDVGYQCPVDGLDEPSLCLPGLKLLNLPCHVLFFFL